MQRHRRSAASLLVHSQPVEIDYEGDGTWRGRSCGVNAFHTSEAGARQAAQAGAVKHLLEQRLPFDVAAARELAERIVADAVVAGSERSVFVDWTMASGMGPDNRERGAFMPIGCLYCPTPGSIKGAAECRRSCDCGYGGWPGNLARKWKRMGGYRNVANAAATRRAGQRLLDMLDGRCSWAPSAGAQPSDCQACAGFAETFDDALAAVRRCAMADHDDGDAQPQRMVVGRVLYERLVHTRTHADTSQWQMLESIGRAMGVGVVMQLDCQTCNGTGRNLAGVIPQLEWVPAFRRKLADAIEPFGPTHDGDDWIDRLIAAQGEVLLDARDEPLTTTLHTNPDASGGPPFAWIDHVAKAIEAGRRPYPVTWSTPRSITRVVPRGEHILMGHNPETAPDLCRGWAPLVSSSPWTPGLAQPSDEQREAAKPAWCRGANRHDARRASKWNNSR